MSRAARRWVFGLTVATLPTLFAPTRVAADVTREEVERAIAGGIRCLKQMQRPDGSWSDYSQQSSTGATSLVALALLSSGESAESPAIATALRYLRQHTAERLNNTYAVALQTMVFAAANRLEDRERIERNATWLASAQIRPVGRSTGLGMWSYTITGGRGDYSNSQYALLGLHAASEAGVAVPAEVWTRARNAWAAGQRRDGSWGYIPSNVRQHSSGSMTCAGISSLIISGLKHYQGQETLQGGRIEKCGHGSLNVPIERGLDWMGKNFDVRSNIGYGAQYRYYYLYGMERAGRLSGRRFFGGHDWYREGAEALVAQQNRVTGAWSGAGVESHRSIATSFALLFLAKGRSPVLINKLRHGPGRDWDNDADDVRNLVDLVSRDWKTLLTWQAVNPELATVEDLLQAPIAYFNGHEMPAFSPEAGKLLRDYVDQGGLIVAEACCGREEFDQGFRQLIASILPEPESKLHLLDEGHPVWRAKHLLKADSHPLWGIERGCRTVVIYSPSDLSCYWNQAENEPQNPAVVRAVMLGQNIVEYATGREIPADKLVTRDVVRGGDGPKYGALRIAKLQHGGDWNVAPLAAPRLAMLVRDKRGFDVVIQPKSLAPDDPGLAGYPLVYMHGRAAFSFAGGDIDALRRHLDPGGGTLFADAACGSPAFDASFRAFVAKMLPQQPLVPIPRDDELYTDKMGYDLSDVGYTKAAGVGRGLPRLEGIKIDGHWAVIYSKYDLGCALESQQSPDCVGYTPESARRIALNIVSYSTLP